MTGEELVLLAAKAVRLYDKVNDDVLTGKYLDKTDLLNYVDLRYREYVVPLLKANYPKFFEKTLILNNWEATGTVDASSTGSTLDVTTPIFASNMVGATVYNSTDKESRTIISFTDTTTVTLDSAIDDTWDGDTIYVLSGRILLDSGDTLAMDEPLFLGIKYTEGDTKFRTVKPQEFEELHEFEYEDTLEYSTFDPVSFFSTETDSNNVMRSAINFRPLPSVPLANSIYFKGTILPGKITLTTTPRLPLGNHGFLAYGAAADAAIALGLQKGDVDRLEAKFKEGMDVLRSTFRPRRRLQKRPYRDRVGRYNRARRQFIQDIFLPN